MKKISKLPIINLELERGDIIKFLIYFLFFLFLLSCTRKVFSPVVNTTFDSASINNKEQIIKTISEPIVSENEENYKEKSLISFAFTPKNVTMSKSKLELIKQIVLSNYFKNKTTPLEILFDYQRKEPRGQMSWYKLTLASQGLNNNSEYIKVLVHELWHFVDINFLKKRKNYDLSDEFYKISWLEYNKKKTNSKMWDFVSWYALSNKYEDFAESFVFYVFHNEEFQKRAEKNTSLKRKYDFFSNYIFKEHEFEDSYFENYVIKSYNRDTTKISVDLKKFFYYIQ